MKRLIERLLIRIGFLPTPDADAYYAWADIRLDHLAACDEDECNHE